MKIPVLAAAGLAVGLLGGTVVSTVRTRGEALAAHAQVEARPQRRARADTSASPPASSGSDGAVAVTLPPESSAPDSSQTARSDSSASPPAVVERTASSLQEKETPAAPTKDSAESSAPISAVKGGDEPVVLPAGPTLDPAGAKKLAKIFGAMKPADAASVLVKMTDEEITAVLLQMNNRLAAPIVGELPPARAAALSKAVLRDPEVRS